MALIEIDGLATRYRRPIEIDGLAGLPIKNGGSFHGKLLNNQMISGCLNWLVGFQ